MDKNDIFNYFDAAVDRLISKYKCLNPETAENVFVSAVGTGSPNIKDEIKTDDSRMLYFSTCYELSIVYLKTKSDIIEQYKSNNRTMTMEERDKLLRETEQIKDAGRFLFNTMIENNWYIDKPEMMAYKEIWDCFYNGKDIDSNRINKFITQSLEQSRETFGKRDNEKMGSQELGKACLNFASAKAFVEFANAAKNESDRLSKLKEHLNVMERLVLDVSEKYAVESKLTEKGFVVHNAFALKDNKSIRNKTPNAVERYILSTPGIYNKISQEYVHVGLFKNKICSLAQQRTYGANKSLENLLDTIRGSVSATQGANKITGTMSKIIGFYMAEKNGIVLQKDMEKWQKDIQKELEKKMPQELLGKSTKRLCLDNINPNDFNLTWLTLCAKIENGLASEYEKTQKSLADNVLKVFKDTGKKAVEDISVDNFNLSKAVESFGKKVENCSITIFDKVRYSDLQNNYQCNGEHNRANLMLITRMASQWDNIEKVSPSEFDEVKSFLEKTFENDIHLHKFTEQNIESNDEIERN